MKLDDPGMPRQKQNDRAYFFACYVASLVKNETLLCKAIKADTMRDYIKVGAEYCTRRQLNDPRFTENGESCRDQQRLYKEHRRWEKMPRRREPVTSEMLDWMMEQEDPNGPDGLVSALKNWSVINSYAGNRLGEWAQEYSDTRRGTFSRWTDIDNSARAFIFKDLVFFKEGMIRTDNSRSKIIKETDVAVTGLVYRFQKNQNNGQMLKYKANKKNPQQCMCNNALAVRRRAQRLRVKKGVPIAVFRDSKGKTCFINNKHIEKWLQSAARAVYKITDPKELALWSAHSYRVGACVQLHIARVDADTIKIRLRWKSDTYRDYLRDVDFLQELHNAAINGATAEKIAIMLDDEHAHAPSA